MTLRIKSKSERCILIAFAAAAILPLTGFAKPKLMMTTDILQHLRKGEPWDRGVFTATKMVMFQQATNTSGGTDATSVSKITLSYFTSTDCSATNGTSVPTYTTPDDTSFTISVGTPFGMVAASAWNVGNSKVSPDVADMTTIQSIAVTLKSTNNNTPQACFGADCGTANSNRFSFACVPVTCGSGECISGSGTPQSFQLKTTAAVGDPADGGIIACMSGGLNNLVVPASNNSTSIVWGGSGTLIGTDAQSNTDGSRNTTKIVEVLSAGNSYAAGLCNAYTTSGGYTASWFLPAKDQLNCLEVNQLAIGGFATASLNYWSSTEVSSIYAQRQNFGNAIQPLGVKTNLLKVRCSRAFTP